ncbi:MAG: M67 family metallopeptidase [Ferrovibrio sp.]
MPLRLTSAQQAELAALAMAAFPREACALLIGRDERGVLIVERIVPAANLAATPEREFELDPAVHVAELRRLREAGGPQKILGHWHSHPNGRAEPSAQDAAMIFDPAMLWLISAVDAAGAAPPCAFRPRADASGFEPFPIQTES